MDLDRFGYPITDEQRGLYETVATFAARAVAPGAAERDRAHAFPIDLVRQMAEMGLMAVKVPLEAGGAGSDNVGYVLVLEALARADVSCAVVIAASNLVSNLLARHGTADQQERLLRPLAEGRLGAASFCLSEPDAGSDAAALTTTATRRGDGWVLDGAKMWITSGAHAGLYLVFATTAPGSGARGIACFAVERGTPGLEIGKEEHKMGQRASGTVALHLSDCFVPDCNRVGEIGGGYHEALAALAAGRAGIAGLCIGIGEAAMREGLAWATAREAFGQRVVDFQNSQFVVADCRTALDQAWLLTLRAARLLDAGRPARMETSMAKLAASEAAGLVTDRMLQLHGGYGYSDEYPIERLYRDARVTRIYEGTSEIQRLIIAREVLRGLA